MNSIEFCMMAGLLALLLFPYRWGSILYFSFWWLTRLILSSTQPPYGFTPTTHHLFFFILARKGFAHAKGKNMDLEGVCFLRKERENPHVGLSDTYFFLLAKWECLLQVLVPDTISTLENDIYTVRSLYLFVSVKYTQVSTNMQILFEGVYIVKRKKLQNIIKCLCWLIHSTSFIIYLKESNIN